MLKLSLNKFGCAIVFGNLTKGPLRMVYICIGWKTVDATPVPYVMGTIADYQELSRERTVCRYQAIATWFPFKPNRSFKHVTGTEA